MPLGPDTEIVSSLRALTRPAMFAGTMSMKVAMLESEELTTIRTLSPTPMLDSVASRYLDAFGERHQLADDHETGRAAQRVCHPHEVESRRAQYLSGAEFVSGGGSLRRRGRYPSGWLVANRWILQQEGAYQRHHQEAAA